MNRTVRGVVGLAAVGSGIASIVAVTAFAMPFYLLLLPLAVVVATTYLRPWWGILGLCALLPFNGLTTDLLVAAGDANSALVVGAAKDAVLATLVVAAFTTGRFRRVRRDLLVLVGALLVVASIAAIWTPSLEQAAYGWRNDFEPLLLLLCVPIFVNDQISRRIALALAISAQVASGIAIATWSLGLDWLYTTGRLPVPDGGKFPSSLFVYRSEYPRAFSPFSGPNELAAAMAILVAVILCQRQWKWLVRALLCVGPIVTVVLAQSRSGQLGVIAAVVAVSAWVVWQRRKVWAIAFLGVAALLGTAGTLYYAHIHAGDEGDPSLGGHAKSLGEAFTMMADRPFGYGLGQVGPRATIYMADPIKVESFWLLLGLEAGVIALLLFVVLLGRLLQISLRAGTQPAFIVAAVLAATLATQLVLPTLQDTAVAYLLWISVGIGLEAAGHVRSPETKETTLHVVA